MAEGRTGAGGVQGVFNPSSENSIKPGPSQTQVAQEFPRGRVDRTSQHGQSFGLLSTRFLPCQCRRDTRMCFCHFSPDWVQSNFIDNCLFDLILYEKEENETRATHTLGFFILLDHPLGHNDFWVHQPQGKYLC